MAGNLGFIGPTYQTVNPSNDAERIVNMYPEITESGHPSTNSRLAYYQTPGTSVFGTVDSPVRALWGGNDRLFVVGGSKLFELNITTGAIAATFQIGSADGPAQIVFIPSGPGLTEATSGALLVWDGSSGVDGSGDTVQNVWYVDGSTGSPPAVISGANIGVLDGYAVVLRPGCSATAGAADPLPISTTDQTQFNLSAIFLGNQYDPLQFAIKTGAPDALQAVFTPGSLAGGSSQELWLFGKQTTEVWYDTGGSTLDPFPFQRVPGAFVNQGLWAKASVCNCNNQLVFLGGDARGVGVVWAMNGYIPQRVSNHAVEMAFQAMQTAGVDTSAATAYSYQENGHIFYVLSFPGARTFVADFSCQDASGRPMWHERGIGASLGSLANSWLYHAWAGGQHFVAGDGTGKVYVSSLGTYEDNGDPILRCRIGPAISNEKKWMRHSQFWLDIGGPFNNTGLSYKLDWSNDGGFNYGTQFTLHPSISSTQQIARVFMNRLGRSRTRNYRVQSTNNAPECWQDAYVELQN